MPSSTSTNSGGGGGADTATTSDDLRPRVGVIPGLDRLALVRWLFFGLFWGYVLPGAFGALLLESKGFSPSSVGWLAATPPFAVLAVVPPMSYLAEIRNWQSHIMFGGLLVGTLLMTVVCVSTSMPVVAFGYVAFNLVYSPVPPLIDEHTLAAIGPERKAAWGSYRCWGAYGWAIAAVIGSIIFGHYGWSYALVIWYTGMALTALAIYETPVKKVPGDHRLMDVLRYVASRRRIITWVAGTSVIGLGYAFIGTFLFLFLNDLGAPSILYGFCIVATVIVEIPLFRNSAKLHAKFSNRQLLLMAFGGWVVRGVGYSLIYNPWYVLFFEPLHGLTFGCMWLSGINFFSSAFPPALANSAIGLLHAGAFGFGPILGNVIGGHLYDEVGPRWMFRIGAVGMACVAVTFHIVESRFEDEEKEKRQREQAEAQAASSLATTATVAVAREEGGGGREESDTAGLDDEKRQASFVSIGEAEAQGAAKPAADASVAATTASSSSTLSKRSPNVVPASPPTDVRRLAEEPRHDETLHELEDAEAIEMPSHGTTW